MDASDGGGGWAQEYATQQAPGGGWAQEYTGSQDGATTSGGEADWATQFANGVVGMCGWVSIGC